MANPAVTPVGTVLMYAGRTDGAGVLNLITAGWILCDGSVYPNSQFPDLFNVIADSYGGSQAGFAVPSYKGMFQRGLDGTDPQQRDPDAGARLAPRGDLSNSGNSGNNVGSVQMDEMAGHGHVYNVYTSYIKSSHTLGNQCLSGQETSYTAATGGTETRPVNQYVDFIIKAVSSPDVVPIGAVLPFASDVTDTTGSTLPALEAAGWLACNGGKQLVSDFQALYTTISDMFGADDQASFRVPDFRGKFLRGVVGQLLPGQQSMDPDYLTRTAPQPGLTFPGNTGNQVGSMEPTQVANHTHSYTYNNDYWSTAATAIGPHAETNAGQTWTSASNSAVIECRPINSNVNYLIRAASA
jgi:microcystin-dependent protein